MARYNNIKLTKHRNRLKAIIGKQECFTDEMISFPVERLDGVVAVEIETNKRNLIVSIKLESGETFPSVPQVKEKPVVAENANRPPQPVATDSSRQPARAPYNFVPLNAIVVEGEKFENFDKFMPDRLTGHIDLIITAKTDIFTRGEKEKFFEINGQYAIPGSTLRGLTRTMVEMVSFGKLGIFDDKRLYNRSLAEPDTTSIRKYYNKMRGNADGDKIKPGYLVFDKQKKSYYIIPIAENKLTKIPSSFGAFQYKLEGNSYKIISGPMANKKHDWKMQLPSEDEKLKKFELPRKDEDDYLSDKTRDAKDKMKDILETAKKNANEFPHGVPIFYSEYIDAANDERVAIGHTKFFRIPYHRSIGDANPHVSSNIALDLAESIFGKAETKGKGDIVAGRVFFEDAFRENDKGFTLSPVQVLSSPKPTAFQLYLEQTTDGHSHKTHRNNLFHWGTDNNKIRGNKLYWHKNGNWKNPQPDMKNGPKELLSDGGTNLKSVISQLNTKDKEILWRFVFNENKKAQFTIVEALNTGTTFRGRIRFENLTDIELGALLFALELPEGYFHKLGMGKSIGLGSIEIKPQLTLTKRNSDANEGRYSSLFSAGAWNLGKNESTSVKTLAKKFSDYIISKIGLDKSHNLWDDERMKELKEMLKFDHGEESKWKEKVKFMTLKDPKDAYRHRWVLPSPITVSSL